MPPFSRLFGMLMMPDDFPVVPFDTIGTGVAKHAEAVQTPRSQMLYRDFAQAFTGSGYRFVSAVRCADSFRCLLHEYGTGPPPAERVRQEHELFGFFTNALSSLECVYFGLYGAGAFLKPTVFTLLDKDETKKFVVPKTTHEAYAKAFPGESVGSALERVCRDPKYAELGDIRNILAHRAVIGRDFHVSASGYGSAWGFPPGLTITADMLTPFRRDLARLLGELLDAGAAFLQRRFPSP